MTDPQTDETALNHKIPTPSQFTLEINPRYNGDQSFQNLKSLKSTVHEILQDEEEGQESTLEKSKAKLQEFLSELVKPSYSVLFDKDFKVNGSVINLKYQSLLLGTSDGKENEEGKGKSHKEVSGLKFHIKDLGSEIVDLHLDGNNLYILTKQNIQSFLMVDWNSLTSEKQLFELKSLKKLSEHTIEEIVYNLEKQKIYLITDQNKDSKKQVAVVNLEPETESFTTEIGLDGHHFHIDYLDDLKIYFICESTIYSHVLEKKKEGFSNFISKGFGMMGGDKDEGEQNLFGSVEFFQGKMDLNFLKFEENMEFFYCDDGQVIKKYKTDNKEVVLVFDDIQALTTQIVLHKKKQLLFSTNKEGNVNIWNRSSGSLITQLKKADSIESFDEIQLIGEGDFLMGCSATACNVWQLVHFDMEKEFKRLKNSPKMLFIKKSEKLLIKNYREIFVLQTKSFKLEKVIKLPDNTVDYEFLPNGDINVVLQNKEFNSKKLQLQRTLKNLMNKKLSEARRNTIEEREEEYMNTSNKGENNVNLDISDDSEEMVNYNIYTTTQPARESQIQTQPNSKVEIDNNLKAFNNPDSKKEFPTEPNSSEEVKLKKKGDSDNNLMSTNNLEADSQMANPRKSDPGLFKRIKGDLEKVEIDFKKYQFHVYKVILEDYSEADPEACRHLIFQCFDKIKDMKTSKVLYSKLNNQSKKKKKKKKDQIERKDTYGKLNNDEAQLYETVFVLENKTIHRIRYLCSRSSAPFEGKVFLEKEVDFSSVSEARRNINSLSLTESISSKKQSRENYSREKKNILSEVNKYKIYGIRNDIETDWTFLAFYAQQKESKSPYIGLIALYKGSQIIQTQVDLTSNPYFNENENFSMKMVREGSSSMGGYLKASFKFYLNGPSSMIIFNFNITEAKFLNFRLVKKQTASDAPILFSQRRSLFFVPIKNTILVYDDQLEILLDTIETDKNIESIILSDGKSTLMIYDLYFYYELDLDHLIVKRKLPATNETKDRFFCPLNFQVLPDGRLWKGVFYHIGRKSIRSVSTDVSLDLISFPFEVFRQCFSKKNYQAPVKLYADYYFEKLDAWRRNDYEFGPISPINMCIFHENSSLMEEVFNDYFYPSRTINYVSPLEHAFIINHKASINELCQALLRRDESISFSRSDFKYLLSSDLAICHKVLSTIISDPNIDSIPKLVYMENEMVTRSSDFLVSMAVQMRRNDLVKDAWVRKHAPEKRVISGLKKYEMSNDNQISKREISVAAVPFKYNYDIGTDDSVMLINRYSHTRSEDLILSDWKEIIKIKWANTKPFYILFFVLYFAFLALTTLSLAFFKSNQLLRFIAMGFSIAFMFYELLRLITFLTYKPLIYFKKVYAYVDWITHIGTLSYFIFLSKDYSSDTSRVAGVLVLLFAYYRGFSYLRIFDAFITLVGIINTIVGQLVVFFVVLFYAYFMVAMLMVRLDNTDNLNLRFQEVYYWVFLGSVEGEAFDIEFSYVAIVVGSLFLTIVMLNILIAYLSNLFSRLEDQQKVNTLRQKALLILDFEMFARLFRFHVYGIPKLAERFDDLFTEYSLSNRELQLTEEIHSLQSYFKTAQYRFILRTTDGEKLEEEKENIYQKVKNLQKASEELSSLVLLKNRVLEKNIQQVRDSLKNSANDQNKTIDDLRELIGNNFKNIFENTESLLFSVKENDKRYVEEFKKVEEVKEGLQGAKEDVAGISKQMNDLQGEMQTLIRLYQEFSKKKR